MGYVPLDKVHCETSFLICKMIIIISIWQIMYMGCSVLVRQSINSNDYSNVELPENLLIPQTKQMFC